MHGKAGGATSALQAEECISIIFCRSESKTLRRVMIILIPSASLQQQHQQHWDPAAEPVQQSLSSRKNTHTALTADSRRYSTLAAAVKGRMQWQVISYFVGRVEKEASSGTGTVAMAAL